MELKITLTGIEITKNAIQKIMDEADFTNVSEEYKRGFCDFGNAAVAMLEAMENERN